MTDTSERTVPAPSLEDIRAAAGRLRGSILRFPLVPLANVGSRTESAEIHLKLENLQPTGSFKVRGAGNAMRLAPPERLARGVYTASAGNMAQGVAWNARRMGVGCSVVVPDNAPRTKLDAVRRLGGKILPVPFEEWWKVLVEHQHPDMVGHFIHPVSDPAVMAGNGTIGLEILDDLPEVDAVVVPYGGGGLSCGIAAGIKALNPRVAVYAAEVETAAPLAASLAAGRPLAIAHQPSFVDGIGGKSVLREMWPLASRLLDGAVVVTLAETAAALQLLFERHRVVAEGAGAAALAAGLSGRVAGSRIACVISGGNIDAERLQRVLAGRLD